MSTQNVELVESGTAAVSIEEQLSRAASISKWTLIGLRLILILAHFGVLGFAWAYSAGGVMINVAVLVLAALLAYVSWLAIDGLEWLVAREVPKYCNLPNRLNEVVSSRKWNLNWADRSIDSEFISEETRQVYYTWHWRIQILLMANMAISVGVYILGMSFGASYFLVP